MEHTDPLARLHVHQRRTLDILFRAAEALGGGDDALSRVRPPLRAELDAVMRDYQAFKHEEIFDPAITSGNAERIALGRAMKIECIGAGEAFRMHRQRWTDTTIAADPDNYRASARLTLNALRRHVSQESEGIARLIVMLNQEPPRAG